MDHSQLDVGWAERSSYRHRRSICLCSVSIWSEDGGHLPERDDARATAELEGRWALVGGAWDASQPAVRNGRDSQLEKKVGVSWRCLG